MLMVKQTTALENKLSCPGGYVGKHRTMPLQLLGAHGALSARAAAPAAYLNYAYFLELARV